MIDGRAGERPDDERGVAGMELDPRVAVLVVGERVLALRQCAGSLEAESVDEPASGSRRPGVAEGETESRSVVELAGRRLAFLHPRAEPRRGDGDERRATLVLAAFCNCRLEPDDRPGGRRLEEHVDRHVVQRALPGQTPSRLPRRDACQLQALAALRVVHLQDASTDTRLAPHLDELARVVRVDRPAYPPQVELVREHGEGRHRAGRHLDHRRP